MQQEIHTGTEEDLSSPQYASYYINNEKRITGISSGGPQIPVGRRDVLVEHKTDDELVMVIEDAINNSGTFLEAFDKVVNWKRKNRGLKGFHVSAPLDVMCGLRKIDDPNEEAEKMAHDVLMMDLACANGQYEDVTDEVL